MEGLGDNADKLTLRVRFWNLQTVLAHAFDMELDGFLDEAFHLCSCGSDRNTTGKIGYVCAETRRAALNDDKILHGKPHFFKPACFRMLASVPGGTSTLGLPATVTVPGLLV